MSRPIGPENNGFPTEMPAEPPYIETAEVEPPSETQGIYDFKEHGDRIHYSNTQWRTLQKRFLLGSTALCAVSCVNTIATRFLQTTSDNELVGFITGTVTTVNFVTCIGSFFTAVGSAISILNVSSIAESSQNNDSSV